MLKELVEKLLTYGEAKQAASDKAKQPQHVAFLSDARQNTFVVDGAIESRPIAIGTRSHNVATVDDLITAVGKWDANPVVWIGRDSIVLVIDDDERRDRVTLALERSQVFTAATSLKSPFSQVDMIRLLRTTFRNAINCRDVLANIRNLKFRNLSEGSVSIQHGNESLGRQINNEVSGADKVPESIVLPLNVYANRGETDVIVNIEFDIEIDAEKGLFHVKPMPDAIDSAVSEAIQSIRDRIESAVKAAVLEGSV